MKKTFTLIVALLVSIVGFSQNKDSATLLQSYLNLKDALVKSDAKQTILYATEMQHNIESASTFSEKESLLASLKIVVASSDLEKQRTAFAALSENMWLLVKNAKGITQTVYYQYCPMKKAYWLSTEAAIKNPYYGSKMLTCGSIKETKKP